MSPGRVQTARLPDITQQQIRATPGASHQIVHIPTHTCVQRFVQENPMVIPSTI
jgi:hypothetical protein